MAKQNYRLRQLTKAARKKPLITKSVATLYRSLWSKKYRQLPKRERMASYPYTSRQGRISVFAAVASIPTSFHSNTPRQLDLHTPHTLYEPYSCKKNL